MLKKKILKFIFPMIFRQKGLTLVEVAIVLVILGLLIGLGASLIGPLTKRAKITETRDIVNAAVESVIGFAAKNNRLPTNTEFPQAVRNPNDAWTKPLVYFVDSSLTTSSNNPAEGICGRKTTNLIVCTDVNCNNQIPDVAFIVVSGGPNYNVQTGPSTTSPCPSGKTCYKVYPQDTPNVDDYPNDFTRQEEYDDIVKWVTLDELRIKAGCQGAQLKILNNELPYGYENSQYNATIYAEGGLPFQSGGKYKWCREGALPSGLNANPSTSSNNCLNLQENSWGQADNLSISGTPNNATSGNYKLIFFVRDNQDPSGSNDNIAQKTLVLTINPSNQPPSGGGCTAYRVWNQTGAMRDFTVSGTCRNNIQNNAEITSPTITLNSGGTISMHFSTVGICTSTILRTLYYNDAVAADTNRDCMVNFTLTGFTDR